MHLRTLLNLHSQRLHALPVAILHLTDKCNSRCNCCDYWRFGQGEISLELVRQLAGELSHFGTRFILLSGGEPLQHPRWETIAATFRAEGLKVAMATNGILLSSQAGAVAGCIDELFVSLDGANGESYRMIRGVDGFDLVREGVGKLAGKVPVTFRTTVQRANYREIPALIRLSRSWGGCHHSFLAVDVNTHTAFARSGEFDRSMALREEDLDTFGRVIRETEKECAAEFELGYIIETGSKLRLMHDYFAALLGYRPFPPVRCNAPRFSAVIETDGSLRPCFFLPSTGRFDGGRISAALNCHAGKDLRHQQRLGRRQECLRCVCPAYKGVGELLGVS
ncbi:MAG: radical SAM protein [Acidobacteriia bacterium]|nr:radical SAM protein [Terriglobia bacterium]